MQSQTLSARKFMHVNYAVSFGFIISYCSNFPTIAVPNVLLRIHPFWLITLFIGKLQKVIQISKL